MEKFKKFEVNNQRSIVGGTMEPTVLQDGRPDIWDNDKKRLIIFM